MCGAASLQESREEYIRTLEVMNQMKESMDKRTDNLKEGQPTEDRTSRTTNRAYSGECGRLGLLRPLLFRGWPPGV